MGGPPDLVKDSNNHLHLVWSDSRSGSWDTFYSPTYNCENITPATTAGLAVLNEMQNAPQNTPFLNYCKNLVEEVIFVPAPNGQNDPNEAFRQWADLANSATHEVAFTVMFWDERHNIINGLPYPGEIVLQGIESLYRKVIEPETTGNYPHGMTVRVLLGIQFNTISLDPNTDQRFSVLDELKHLDIPIYKVLDDGRVWRVEVGLYKFGHGSGLPPGTHSHVKLMVVDNNKMIVSGYHPQYIFRTNGLDAGFHDLGLQVSGPIAANGMAVFDSLWEGSEILCTEEDAWAFDYLPLGLCHTGLGENPTHWFFTQDGNDIILPLYRDDTEKTADQAIKMAIESADTEVYVLQNRVGVSGDEDVPQYEEGDLLEYATALLAVAPKENLEIRILMSGDLSNYFYNSPSLFNFLDRYYLAGGQQNEGDLVRFYALNIDTDNPPGLHAKSFVVDRGFLVIGSQNFDHSAFGDNADDLDLVEYSLGIENTDIVSNLRDGYLEDAWNTSGKLRVIRNGDSLENSIQQANFGDVIIIEPGIYEISSTLIIPEGVKVIGLYVTVERSPGFSNQTGGLKLAAPALQTTPAPLLRITGSNVTIMGLTLQDSTGYAIEIEGGVENIYLSNIVFEDNALGGVYVQGNTSYTVENNTFVGGGSGVTIASNVNTTGTIRNNIFTGQTIAPIEITSADDGNVEYSYNLFDQCDLGECAIYWHVGDMSASSNAHDNLFDVDPLFVNPSMGNYRLYPNSPAIDAGDPAILHEFLVDGNGDSELRIDIGAFEYGLIPNVAPIVTAGDDQTVELGGSVTVNAGYSDADNSEDHFAQIDWGDGMVEDVAVNTTSPGIGEVTGQHAYTNPGEYAVEICVTDLYGSAGCDTINITVLHHFNFTGFFPPVDNQPMLNVVKAGSAIPIKFSLGGYQGLNIFSSGYPASAVVTCGSSTEDAIEQTVTAGASSLSYDATTDQYTYVWKTDKLWADTCRTLVLKLTDGSYHRADFKFKK